MLCKTPNWEIDRYEPEIPSLCSSEACFQMTTSITFLSAMGEYSNLNNFRNQHYDKIGTGKNFQQDNLLRHVMLSVSSEDINIQGRRALSIITTHINYLTNANSF
jgi:hypothetical protein